LQLDVNSAHSIYAAVSMVQSEVGRIDILINNAGITSKKANSIDRLRESLETNVVSSWAVSEAFKPLLLAPPAGFRKEKRIINVTSELGSVTWRNDPNCQHYDVDVSEYRMSKAALNMMTACQLTELQDHGVNVFAFNPGWTATELSGSVDIARQYGAPEPNVPAAGCVQIVAGERDHEVGRMLQVDGIVPW
jgi:NAD(P)-dependent dehydrogenase (short-subunit alcohol dehydrogenase family)